MAVPPRAADLEPPPLARPGPLGGIRDGLRAGWAGTRAAGVRLVLTHVYWTPVAGLRPDPAAVAEPRGASPSSSLFVAAHRDRVAALRRAATACFAALSLGDPAERAERALAARSAAALRTDDLPCLPGAGRARQSGFARAHRDRGRQLAAARRLGRAMGALAVGGMRLALRTGRGAAPARWGPPAASARSRPARWSSSYPRHRPGHRRRRRSSTSAPKRIVPVGCGPAEILRSLGLDKRTTTVDDSRSSACRSSALIRRAKPDLIVAAAETDPLDGLARAARPTHRVYVEPGGSVGDVGPGDRGHRSAHRPAGPGTAADGADRGEARSGRSGGRRHAARDRVRRHRRLRDDLQAAPCSAI